MASRHSTFPNNTPIRLPPPSPPLKFHPQASNNSPLPVVYSLKLPQDVVKTLLSAHSAISVRFTDAKAGEIIVPNANPIAFGVRPIADPNAATARAACYTRRDNSLRTVGPIIAELDVERTLSSSISAATKKRTLEARKAGNARDLKFVDDIPSSHPAKKARKKPVEKRPRAPRRPGLASAPLPPPSKPPGTLPASVSPPFRSPAVSPGYANGKPNGSRRSTPTRNSFSGMPSRKVSPSSMASALPKPVSRLTPTKSNRFSPVESRGPSPSVNSPGSPPRVASIRAPRVDDGIELRRQLIHFLAIGENNVRAIKDRLMVRKIEVAPMVLTGVLSEIANTNRGNYVLKEESWADVTEKFEYSDTERTKMKMLREEVVYNNKTDKSKRLAMSDNELDAATDKLLRDRKKEVGKITSDKEDGELRKTFAELYPVYSGMICWMEELHKTFRALETRFLAAKGKDERENLGRRITGQHHKYRDRHAKFEKILPVLHGRMKEIRRALDDYSKNGAER